MKKINKKIMPTMLLITAMVILGSFSTVLAAEEDGFKWIHESDEEINPETSFEVWGDDLSNKQRIENVATITKAEEWVIDLYVDGYLEGCLSLANYTASTNLNLTSYNWSYQSDYKTPWNYDRNCSGWTAISILNKLGVTEAAANVSFVPYDGYVGRIFNQSELENGIFTNPDIDWEGKQTMIMVEQNETYLGYTDWGDGPFRVIAPGENKGKYIGGIVSIEVDTSAEDKPESSSPTSAAEEKVISNSTVAPDAEIEFKEEINISLSQIIADIEAGKYPVDTINDSGFTYYGVSPLYLMEKANMLFASKININATDGFGNVFEVTEHFMLRDPNIYSHGDENSNVTMLAFGYKPISSTGDAGGIDAFNSIAMFSFSIFAIYIVMKKIKKH